MVPLAFERPAVFLVEANLLVRTGSQAKSDCNERQQRGSPCCARYQPGNRADYRGSPEPVSAIRPERSSRAKNTSSSSFPEEVLGRFRMDDRAHWLAFADPP